MKKIIQNSESYNFNNYNSKSVTAVYGKGTPNLKQETNFGLPFKVS